MKVRKTSEKRVEPEVTPVKVESPSPDTLSGVWIQLPSRGLPYEGELKLGKLMLRPPKVRDTKFLAEMTAQSYEESLTTMITQMLITPKIDPWSLTSGDRSYLFLWIRAQVHDRYYLTVMCPHCSYTDENYDFPLSEVSGVLLTEKYSGPKEITLDKSKDKVTLGLVLGSDERDKDKFSGVYADLVLGIASSVKLVNGKVLSFEDRCKWVENLPSGDEVVIVHWAAWVRHGPDYNDCRMTCRRCSKVSRLRLPFRPEFLYPTVQFARDFGDAADSGSVRPGGVVSGDAGSK